MCSNRWLIASLLIVSLFIMSEATSVPRSKEKGGIISSEEVKEQLEEALAREDEKKKKKEEDTLLPRNRYLRRHHMGHDPCRYVHHCD
ncbi:hypothetical protein RB195_007474 [Necator americanus]|uniref:Uncharacterized protein n=2 Tax=Necator americanus TaxID=51031 RepID=A0ABR1C0X9_NECAM